jgi:hypothetical protein
MKRNQWEFPYTADKLLDAAKTKSAFHSERLTWWEDKNKHVMETIKAEGLEIDESVALGYSNSGRHTSVQVRNDLLRDLNECTQKTEEHKGKLKDYDAWIEVLASQGQSSFTLHQEDWLFFFGK